MDYASREQDNIELAAPMRRRQHQHLSSQNQPHQPKGFAVAATGDDAMFIGTHVLEHY